MNRRDRWMSLLISAAVFLALAPGAFIGLHASWCTNVVGGLRVLDGEVPYRDFWSLYAPGQFYLTAGLYSVFGRELLVQALATVLVRAASAGVLFALARRLGASAALAALVALAFGATMFEQGPVLGSYPPALLLLLCALVLVLDSLRSGRRRWLAAGLLIGAAAWFKHDVAGYFAIALGLALAVSRLALGREWPAEWPSPWSAIGALACGCVVALAPVVALLAAFAGADAWQDLIVFPLTDFAKVRGEAMPGLLPRWPPLAAWLRAPGDLRLARDGADAVGRWAGCNAPPWMFALSALYLWRRGVALEPWKRAAAWVLLAALPFYWWAAHVQQNTHPRTMAALAFLLGVLVWSSAGPALKGWRLAVFAVAALDAIGLAMPAVQAVYPLTRPWWHGEPVALPGASGIRASDAERELYQGIARFVRANTDEGEPIHSGLARHDAVVINNLLMYPLCGRPPATRYHELHPGVGDRLDVQMEMIGDLQEKSVRCVIEWRFGWSKERLDDIRDKRMRLVPGTGATLLDEFIRAEFEPVLEIDEYAVLWRRGAPRGGRP